MKTRRVTFPIDDLGYGGEGMLIIKRALSVTPGVVRVYVNTATEMVYIEFDPVLSDPDSLVKVVEHAGFHAGLPSFR
jgi:hypothetical protein